MFSRFQRGASPVLPGVAPTAAAREEGLWAGEAEGDRRGFFKCGRWRTRRGKDTGISLWNSIFKKEATGDIDAPVKEGKKACLAPLQSISLMSLGRLPERGKPEDAFMKIARQTCLCTDSTGHHRAVNYVQCTSFRAATRRSGKTEVQ